MGGHRWFYDISPYLHECHSCCIYIHTHATHTVPMRTHVTPPTPHHADRCTIESYIPSPFRPKFHAMPQFSSTGRHAPPVRVANIYVPLVALCVCMMRKLAGACFVVPGPSPAAFALMSYYDRRPKKTPWVRFIESEQTNSRDLNDSQPHGSDGLTTPPSPTSDAGDPTAARTAVADTCGHQPGHSPDRLSCTPGRASQPSDVLDSPGCTRAPMDRGLKRPREAIDGPTPPCSPASSSTSPSSSRRTPRVQAKLKVTVADGAAAVNFRSSGTAGRKWLSVFIHDRWGCHPGDCEYDKLKKRVQRSIRVYELEAANGEALQKPGKGKVNGGHRCRVVNPKERVRLASRTRQCRNTRMPELGQELFQWWVDLAQVMQARVPTCMIMAEARLMIEDAIRHAKEAREQGRATPSFTVPYITFMWISRWRRFFSIVPKCITCSYKVSYAKKILRLGVLWRNATRLLVFHEFLFGPDKLTFVSMDEKPYRFNACGGDKVWAIRGQKAVKCKELRAMLLSRWTGITVVFSRRHPAACLPDGKWQPRWTALFKAIDGSRCDITSPDSRCQVLFAPNGSVNSPTWIQYLGHILPRVANPEHAVVPVTDWYGPHLMEEAVDFAQERTTSPTLFIGGGTTGEAAVCDKTPHRFLAQRYRVSGILYETLS